VDTAAPTVDGSAARFMEQDKGALTAAEVKVDDDRTGVAATTLALIVATGDAIVVMVY